jgi:hypothetical protein
MVQLKKNRNVKVRKFDLSNHPTEVHRLRNCVLKYSEGDCRSFPSLRLSENFANVACINLQNKETSKKLDRNTKQQKKLRKWSDTSLKDKK